MEEEKKFNRKKKKLTNRFPFPWNDKKENEKFEDEIAYGLHLFNKIRPKNIFENSEYWRFFFGEEHKLDYSKCKDALFPLKSQSPKETIKELISLFQGMPIWTHPFSMINVLPSVSSAALVAGLLSNIASPNLLSGEYAWNTARAELETIAMVASIIGWDPSTTGGVFTFGGTGCYFYAFKMALTKVLGRISRFEGVGGKAVVLVSKVAHYSKQTCADWSRLGINQLIEIDVQKNGAMNLCHLEKILQECRRTNRPIAMIVATMGTTDAFVVDPIFEIKQLLDQYENSNQAPRPFLYADAVIGWVWLVFRHYDFDKNPLEISADILKIAYNNCKKLEPMKVADAIGIDFHKTGCTPAVSSMIIVKDNDIFSLLKRNQPAYLSSYTDFNPFLYTLETSRAGTGAISAWATIKELGCEGFQVLLATIIEAKKYLVNLLEKDCNLVCVNSHLQGYTTLFRVYPAHVDAKNQYHHEFSDQRYCKSLYAFNILQKKIANKLFKMGTGEIKIMGWESPPYISFSSGFIPPNYSIESPEYWVFALKAYPVSPFSEALSMLLLRNYILKARDLVIDDFIALLNDTKDEQMQEFTRDELVSLLSYYCPSQIKFVDLLGERTVISNDNQDKISTIKAMLNSHPCFSHLSSSAIYEVIHLSTVKEFKKGEIICREGEAANHVYLVLSGCFKVSKVNKSTQQSYLITHAWPGSMLGEMALFEGGIRSATIEAETEGELLCMENTLIAPHLMTH